MSARHIIAAVAAFGALAAVRSIRTADEARLVIPSAVREVMLDAEPATALEAVKAAQAAQQVKERSDQRANGG